MSKPYTGGCACGALRYEIVGEPMVMLDCQCRQCQRDSGTGHQSHMTFVGAEVEVTGQATRWQATGDGGTVKDSAFCPTCGAPVYMTFPAMPDFFAIRAASLDEPERFKPQIVVWTAAAQPWDLVDRTLPAFPKMPPQG